MVGELRRSSRCSDLRLVPACSSKRAVGFGRTATQSGRSHPASRASVTTMALPPSRSFRRRSRQVFATWGRSGASELAAGLRVGLAVQDGDARRSFPSRTVARPSQSLRRRPRVAFTGTDLQPHGRSPGRPRPARLAAGTGPAQLRCTVTNKINDLACRRLLPRSRLQWRKRVLLFMSTNKTSKGDMTREDPTSRTSASHRRLN